jgi:hypothetical protein
MTEYRSTGGHLAAAMSLVLLVVGCGGGPDESPDLAAGSTSVADPSSTTGSAEPPGGTGTENPSTPRPEGTDPEQPRPPERPEGSVAIAGPGIGKGDEPELSAQSPTGCLRVVLSDDFAEDARVEAVSVGPAGVFGREDAPCGEQGKAPLCPGFVFRAAEPGSACSVGLRWWPDSQEPDGLLSMRFSATCHTREGACAVVDPGTPVTFTSSLALRALIFDEEEGSGDGHGEGEPPDDPGDGQSGNGQPDGDHGDGDQPDGDQPDGDQGAGSDGGVGDST